MHHIYIIHSFAEEHLDINPIHCSRVWFCSHAILFVINITLQYSFTSDKLMYTAALLLFGSGFAILCLSVYSYKTENCLFLFLVIIELKF